MDLYDLWYRFGTPPWTTAARAELVDLVARKALAPCRALDLGCGVGNNAIFLAEHGFEVTGLDRAPTAIHKAKEAARRAGVSVHFEVNDLTDLRGELGTFDLLVDCGTFDDLGKSRRDRYLANVLPLARPGATFLLWCFEWELSWWERILNKALPLTNVAMEPGAVERDFSEQFVVHVQARERHARGWPRGTAVYRMTRRSATARTEDAPATT